MEQVVIIVWKVLKVLPIVGYVAIIASAPSVFRKKGYVLGLLALILDCLPVICLIKAGIEVFTGDLIPDKFEARPVAQLRAAA